MKKNWFPIGFWNYVDCGRLDPMKEAKTWKELGMTLAMSFEYHSKADRPCMIKTLNACEKQGLRVIVCDCRTHWKNLEEKGEAAFAEDVKKAVDDFGSHKAFYAFHVGDEPDREHWQSMKKACEVVSRFSVPFVNFYPVWEGADFEEKIGVPFQNYGSCLLETLRETGLNMLAYDCYNQCYEYEKEKGLESYFANLNLFGKTAMEQGVPMWTSLLSVGHWCYRVPTEDDLRWQISTSVAHGAKGLLWFFVYERALDSSYRLSPIDLYENRTETFERLARQNKIFKDHFSSRLAGATLDRVTHFNKSYGRTETYAEGSFADFEISTTYGNPLILSKFHDEEGEFVLIVNNSQNNSERVRGSLERVAFDEWLAPGQMKLLKYGENGAKERL